MSVPLYRHTCMCVFVSQFGPSWCQTLRRKGLGLEGSELDSEESMQVTPDKYSLGEGMDLSVARQRFYVSPRTQTHTIHFNISTFVAFSSSKQLDF